MTYINVNKELKIEIFQAEDRRVQVIVHLPGQTRQTKPFVPSEPPEPFPSVRRCEKRIAKTRRVWEMLQDPQWEHLSVNRMAKLCKVSPSVVKRVKRRYHRMTGPDFVPSSLWDEPRAAAQWIEGHYNVPRLFREAGLSPNLFSDWKVGIALPAGPARTLATKLGCPMTLFRPDLKVG